MNIENISYLLFGASIATLLRNIWDYYLNLRFLNSDGMGAMINWHYGFWISWIFFCAGISCYPNFKWFYGLILIPFAMISTFLFWFPVHWTLKFLKLIEKENY